MGQHTSKQRLRGAIQATHARRFCSGSTGEVTRGKLLEVYGVSADAPGDYFLWLAPRSPSMLAGADSGPTAWPDGNGEGRRKGGSSPLFSRGQVNPARNFKAGGISFVSSLSAAFPHPPGLLSLGAGAPWDGTPPFQACPRNLLPPPCPDPSQKPLLLQCSPLRLRFIILREHLGHSRKRFDLTLRCCDSVALEQALDIGALNSTTGDPRPHRG